MGVLMVRALTELWAVSYFSGTATAMMCAAYLIKARFSFNDGEAEDAYMEKVAIVTCKLI